VLPAVTWLVGTNCKNYTEHATLRYFDSQLRSRRSNRSKRHDWATALGGRAGSGPTSLGRLLCATQARTVRTIKVEPSWCGATRDARGPCGYTAAWAYSADLWVTSTVPRTCV